MMDEQTSDRTNDGETVNANFADHVMSRPAIGYVRVSTKGQGAKGVSLDAQRAGIESFANTAGYSLIETYQDVGSGVGAKSLVTRDGLRSALDHVLRENAHLIVYDWDRLSRHAGFESDILKYLPDRDRVVCAKHGNNMRDASRAGEFARNEAVAKEISKRTKDAMKRMRSEGAVFGNPKIREDVQPLGAAKWSQAADDLVLRIAGVLRDVDGDPAAITHAAVAKLLNDRGVLTLHGKNWNASRVRVPLRKALKLLRAEDEARMRALPTFGRF